MGQGVGKDRPPHSLPESVVGDLSDGLPWSRPATVRPKGHIATSLPVAGQSGTGLVKDGGLAGLAGLACHMVQGRWGQVDGMVAKGCTLGTLRWHHGRRRAVWGAALRSASVNL
mmetsp:Transcript_147240/g.257222  ORF Transcript_147240/g.257222 Transcript_147240/m.257222 type:complete len:114 (+) Transcript_147240:374-715(+)